jgi:hypothetical protein
MSKTNDENNILSRVFGSFFRDGYPASERDSAAPATDTTNLETAIEKSVAQLNDLHATWKKLGGLRANEIRKHESIKQELESLDAQRIEALTAHRISGNENDLKRADELYGQIEKRKREVADISGVAKAIEQKIAALKGQIETADRGYRINLGKFFDAQMDVLAGRYNAIAPEFVRVVTDIDALYKTMLEYQCGDSNGWWKDARVPTIKPRDGKIYPPIMDTTSSEFDTASRRRALELIAAFKEGGYMSRFDK